MGEVICAAAALGLPPPVHTLRAAMIGRDGKAAREVVDEGPTGIAGEAGDGLQVSVILPCLNEAETMETCVTKALVTLQSLGLRGEVVVIDNGSTDGSAEIAERSGARVVHETRRGYGSALMRGAEEARAPFIIMADADDSYDLTDLGRFVQGLAAGNDLVMGSRIRGSIEPGAMPWLHRWVGNPILTGLLNLLFGAGVSDAHCGMRAFTKDAYRRMQLQTTGMEFASEMVIKAALGNLRITEFPITLRPDGRSRPPHLRSFRDGWRHLRFMLLFSPTYLFVLPGLLCIALGLVPLIALGGGPRRAFGLNFDVHYMVRRQPAHRARLPDPHHRRVRQGLLARGATLRPRPDAAGAAALLQPGARSGRGRAALPRRLRHRCRHFDPLVAERPRDARRRAPGAASVDTDDRRRTDAVLLLLPQHARRPAARVVTRERLAPTCA